MRRCVLVAPKVGIVNFPGDFPFLYLKKQLDNRQANGIAHLGERVVRLPRKMCRIFHPPSWDNKIFRFEKD